MDDIEIFLRVCLLGFSLILTFISVLAMRRARGAKMYFAFGAFFVFLIEGIVLTYGTLNGSFETNVNIKLLIALNMLALLLFYGSVAK